MSLEFTTHQLTVIYSQSSHFKNFLRGKNQMVLVLNYFMKINSTFNINILCRYIYIKFNKH